MTTNLTSVRYGLRAFAGGLGWSGRHGTEGRHFLAEIQWHMECLGKTDTSLRLKADMKK